MSCMPCLIPVVTPSMAPRRHSHHSMHHHHRTMAELQLHAWHKLQRELCRTYYLQVCAVHARLCVRVSLAPNARCMLTGTGGAVIINIIYDKYLIIALLFVESKSVSIWSIRYE
jgi:hypothetical protein